MFSRIRDRIVKLEEQILPKRRVFVFFRDEDDPDLPLYAEQLAAFKAEKGEGRRPARHSRHGYLHLRRLTASRKPEH